LAGGALALGLDLILVELLVRLTLIGALVGHQRPVLLVLAAGLDHEQDGGQSEQGDLALRGRAHARSGPLVRLVIPVLGCWHDRSPATSADLVEALISCRGIRDSYAMA
jgi:hypothetical protein